MTTPKMARYFLGLIAVLLFISSMLSVLGFQVESPQEKAALSRMPTAPLTSCQVKVVFDGDTFGCDLNRNGRIESPQEHVRMLGIDATEMHYSRKNTSGRDEPFAKEAKQWVEANLLHRPAYLESDVKPRDKYNRVLAYVYLDPKGQTMANASLIQAGLAKVLFIGQNRRYEARFYKLEREARQAHRKLWQ